MTQAYETPLALAFDIPAARCELIFSDSGKQRVTEVVVVESPVAMVL